MASSNSKNARRWSPIRSICIAVILMVTAAGLAFGLMSSNPQVGGWRSSLQRLTACSTSFIEKATHRTTGSAPADAHQHDEAEEGHAGEDDADAHAASHSAAKRYVKSSGHIGNQEPAGHEKEADDHDHEAAGEEHEDHAGEKEEAGHDEHEHAAAADHKHEEAAAVTLSQAAAENVGIRLAVVELRPFDRSITIPAMVVERPGRSNVQVTAPLTGVVTHIWPMQGESISPGQPLFDLRLTHEEVVEAQGQFLQTAEELDVVQREIARLESIVASGVVAGKTILERKYEQQKLEGVLRSFRQRLLLHGLSEEQVDGILAKRTLLSHLTVDAPVQDGKSSTDPSARKSAPPLQVETLNVEQGQHVKAGDLLCVLADYSELQIEGKAFEQDMPVLDNAAAKDWDVTAVLAGQDRGQPTVPGLKILSVANTIDPESRALLFHVQLPNKLIRDRRTPDGRHFCGWQFKPGQRLELLVPVERWENRIVLPVDAVVQDGAESFVFEKNGDHFDRRTVRVEYRDPRSVVLANDGTVAPGKTVIVAGAYQVHLAMKNKTGAAPDPHAGHNH